MTKPFSIAGIATGPAPSVVNLSGEAVAWAKERGISQQTLERLGVASGTAFFPDLQRKSPALFFQYRDGWKARAFPEKSFVASKGLKMSFWGEQDAIGSNDIFITEGELDRCAMVESGVAPECVVSVPNGAKQRTTEEPAETRGYGYVEAALSAGLNRAKRFIWCGDGDDTGLSLRADMARILGAARFWFVEWPEGCKDPNDVLRAEGAEFLYGLVTNGILPWPVAGLYRLNELPEPAPLSLWHPGFSEWENKLLLAPRTLSVVTGHPGHGKTQLWVQIWYQIIQAYHLIMCCASFETRPKPHIRRQLRSLYWREKEKNLTADQIKKADDWISEHYFFAVHPEQRQSLEWFLDIAEVAIVRHGARVIQIDPWNRLEASRGQNETETEYIGRCLRTLYVFASDMNCHVQIIAHPSKMESSRRGRVPDLEDIAGSKHWENMVDQGFVVHRPQMFDGVNRKTEAMLYHKKSRFDELGYPCKLALRFDLETMRYVSIDYEPTMGKATHDD
jgi:twinkle protein